ncbi:MAG: serine hydrolase domain-containing protein [Bacteroidota bacterium]
MKSLFSFLTALLICWPSLHAQTLIDSLNQSLQNLYDNSGLPGFAVAIVDANGVSFTQGYGYANLKEKVPYTPQTVQNIASISKTVIGLNLMKAVEMGKLQLDDPINKYLPFEIHNPWFPERPITIRHLATHSSSIRDRNYSLSYLLEEEAARQDPDVPQDWLAFIAKHKRMDMETFFRSCLVRKGDLYKKKNFLKKAPGTTKSYSNIGAALAAFVLEKAVGKPFYEFSREQVTGPLMMEHSDWMADAVTHEPLATLYFPDGKRVPNYSLITYPDGSFRTSVADMSLYLQEMIKGYTGQSDYMSPSSFKALLPGDEDESRVFWGMGETSRNIGHNGGDPGVRTDMHFNADTKIGYILFCNMSADEDEKLHAQYLKILEILHQYGPEL